MSIGNSGTDKKYSRNLGKASGIELFQVEKTEYTEKPLGADWRRRGQQQIWSMVPRSVGE